MTEIETALPDGEEPDRELTDEDVEVLVGNLDDDAPVVLETAPPMEAIDPPETWDPSAHDELYANDPGVVINLHADEPEEVED